MKKITCYNVLSACALTLIASAAFAAPWKFGVTTDTQWPNSPDNKNPNGVAVNIANHINTELINKGVKFVIQVGDLTDAGTKLQLDTRATFTQALYDHNIGFYPLRGNHENSTDGAAEFLRIFPQTQGGKNNLTPVDAFIATTYYGTPATVTTPTFSVVKDDVTVSESSYAGLTYSFDYDNARFVLIDTWGNSSSTKSYMNQTDINWVGDQFAARPANTHAFSFAHKGLITENHADNLFEGTAATTDAGKTLMESFMKKLQDNGVRYHMNGHDHMHNRAIITSPVTGNYKVQNITGASNSYKFYTPPSQTSFNGQAFRAYENQISQELYTVGYYVFTVDGPKVTADYYAMPNGGTGGTDLKTDTILYDSGFTKHETFGYSLNGKEFLVAQNGNYNVVTDDTTKAIANGETGYKGTNAAILKGTNGSTGKDYNLRALTKSINTGWTPAANAAGLASDIFSLWGMQNSLANPTATFANPNLTQTDTYALSLSFDPTVTVNADFINAGHSVTLSMKDSNGNWVNAADLNVGGRKRFILGAYNSAYPLGTYGVDAVNHTAWAVINSTNGPAEFAVVQK